MKLAATMRPDQHLLINLSGRGDKDIGTVADLSGADSYCRPSCQGQGVKGGPQQVSLIRDGVGPRSEVKEEGQAQPAPGDMSGGGQRRPESALGSNA